MNIRAQIPWRSTPHADKLARVKALTEEGRSATEIAEFFNVGLPKWLHTTRNAVIGFWHRNGIVSQSDYKSAGGFTPEAQAKAQATRSVRNAAAAAIRNINAKKNLGIRTGNAVARDTIAARRAREGRVPENKVPEAPAAAPVHGAVPMLEVRSFQCRAVVAGCDERGLAMMCGAQTLSETSSWCAHHAKLYVVKHIPKVARPVRRFNA